MKLDKKISLFIAAAIVSLTLLFAIIQEEPAAVQPEPEVTLNDDMVTESQPAGNFTVFVSRDVCEGCHASGKPFIPQALSVKQHTLGGAYCLACHTISHDVHPINQNVTCDKCHGTPPTAPAFFNGNISCNNCHDYPDPLLPSKGNIITIHKPRGITCNTCHTNECTKCHTEVGKSEKWEKRLNHFRVIMNLKG